MIILTAILIFAYLQFGVGIFIAWSTSDEGKKFYTEYNYSWPSFIAALLVIIFLWPAMLISALFPINNKG